MSSHSSYTHMHTHTQITKTPQLWPLNYGIFVFTASNSPQDHSDLMVHPLLFPQGSHWLHKPLKLRYLLRDDSTFFTVYGKSAQQAGLERDHHQIPLKPQGHHSCWHTKHSKNDQSGANTHTFPKDIIRSVFGCSTQCLETWHQLLFAKYSVTQRLH